MNREYHKGYSHELHRDIWQTLKAEVIKGYAQSEGA